MNQQGFIYELDENPPLFKGLLYGFQWVMITIPNVMIFTALCSGALGLGPEAQISFSQRLLIVIGIMNILQSLKGHRYPVLEAPSSAVLLSFIVLAPQGLSVIEGGLIFGSLLLVLLGAFKWFKRLSPLFTPNVIGVILMLVALTLLPFITPLIIGTGKVHPDGDLSVFVCSLLIMLFVSILSHWVGGFFQTVSMLAGILFGLILYLGQGKISFAVVGESPWFSLPSPFIGVWPTLSIPAILTMIFTYVAVMINTVGSIQGISEIVGKEGLEDRINRGICMTGVGGLLAAFFGAAGLVSVSMSTGVVLVSRVASRYVLTMSGALMVLCAFIPKLWALLTVIPPSVIAAVLFVALASQLVAGMSVIMSNKREIERREYFSIGLPLLLGGAVSILPKPFFQFIPEAISSLVSNGLVVGLCFSIFSEHLLFRARKK
jgi:uracil permease